MTLRERIIEFVKEKYKSEPEYLWNRFPEYAVFRHSDNKKWFGIIMNVRKRKLGLDSDEVVDILNVIISAVEIGCQLFLTGQSLLMISAIG